MDATLPETVASAQQSALTASNSTGLSLNQFLVSSGAFASVRIGAFVCPAIVVRQRRDVDPVRRAGAARTGVFVGADVDERCRIAMIGVLEHDHVLSLRVRAREA